MNDSPQSRKCYPDSLTLAGEKEVGVAQADQPDFLCVEEHDHSVTSLQLVQLHLDKHCGLHHYDSIAMSLLCHWYLAVINGRLVIVSQDNAETAI